MNKNLVPKILILRIEKVVTVTGKSMTHGP